MSNIKTEGVDSNVNESGASIMALTPSEVCEQFLGGCHPATFWRLRKRDESFPKAFVLTGKPLFHRADVQEWYDRTRQSQSEAAA